MVLIKVHMYMAPKCGSLQNTGKYEHIVKAVCVQQRHKGKDRCSVPVSHIYLAVWIVI